MKWSLSNAYSYEQCMHRWWLCCCCYLLFFLLFVQMLIIAVRINWCLMSCSFKNTALENQFHVCLGFFTVVKYMENLLFYSLELSTFTLLCHQQHHASPELLHLSKLKLCTHQILTPSFLSIPNPGKQHSTFCLYESDHFMYLRSILKA